MKVAVIGAGLIGKERIEALKILEKETNGEVELVGVFDTNESVLATIKEKYQVPVFEYIHEIYNLEPDWVFIAVPNDVAGDMVKQAFKAGANVVVEKPFGRTLIECEEIIQSKPEHLELRVGFNYRFFAGIEAALRDAKNGKFGKLISVNFILGHGNSPGMEKSWKLDPVRCGDCVTDLGVHLFDLILQLSNSSKVSVEHAKSWSGYWNTGIEEETHMLLSDEVGTIFNAQVSMNRWRSTFKMEINGTEGYGVVDCRGRSYGPQSYKTGVRWGWLDGKSQVDTEILVIDKDPCINSFIKETASILGVGTSEYNSSSKACTHLEAHGAMELLEQCKSIMK